MGGGNIRRNLSVQGINHNGAGKIVSVKVRHVEDGALEDIAGDYFFSTMPVQELVACMNPPAPAAIRALSDGLIYRDFITVGVLCKKINLTDVDGNVVRDNWIYIQEPDVFVGRIQIFNNWSPSLVADPKTIWIGLEYFCSEGDELWQRSDAGLLELAKEELAAMNMVARSDVIDAIVIRVPKAYPAYFGTYDRFPQIVAWANGISNLFLIGRNGMHKYNNQDHSMLTAMTAVDNIIDGVGSRDNLWALNTEQEYHEEESDQDRGQDGPQGALPLSQRCVMLLSQPFLVAVLFGAALCIPAVKLSLWLDEILQLLLTRGNTSWSSLLNGIAGNAGGVPLGYLTQAACIRLLGYSTFSSRLPSLLAGVFSCLGIGLLAIESRVKRPLLALLLFCLLPLQVRYSVEARPYEQALCLTIWASVVFLRLVAKPSVVVSLLYAVIAGLAIYTQPFAYFTMLAQILWLTLLWAKKRTPQLLWAFGLSLSGVLLAGMSFIPWFSFARAHWHQAIAESIPSKINFSTLLVIAHEITGGGYVGAILLTALSALGLRASMRSRADRLFWAIAIVMPIAFTLISDEAFRYFFATRQIIFVLPPLAILSVYGYEELMAKSKAISLLVGAAVVAALLVGDIHYFSKPREDWQRASGVIESHLRPGNACYAAVPSDASVLFEFFDPELRRQECPNLAQSGLNRYEEVIVATEPYSSAGDLRTSIQRLLLNGFQPVSVLVRLQPSVRIWTRRTMR